LTWFPLFQNAAENSKRRIKYLLRSITAFTALFVLLAGAIGQPFAAQEKGSAPTQEKTPPPDKQKTPTPGQEKKALPGQVKTLTAEQVAEAAILYYGSRGVLDQIRRNGIERGHITRLTADGRSEEATYERRFTRGADSTKDKIRMDQKMPTMEYSLVYGGGRMWGIINGASFTPRKDAAASFMSQHWHSVDALLRYKENGSTLTYVGKEKQKGLDFYVLDLVDTEKRSTRYYISVKTLRILWLEYEEPSEAGAPVKYTRQFHDYRYPQNTLLPYRSVLLADGKQVQEARILSVTFGLKLEDSVFQNPEAQAGTSP
jgi:hypothetical protein